jgi:hypothetical protein
MSAASFADPLTERLVAFARSIGIDVRAASNPIPTCCAGCADRKGIPP